jgi:hypothetical protein
MKKCQIHISPAPECLVPCPEEATEILPLGNGMRMYLCKNHYKSMNSTIPTTNNKKKTIIDIDGLN